MMSFFGSGISWSIKHIGCSENNAADGLARLGSLDMNFIDYD